MIKKIALADTLLPQEFTIGLHEPQTDISVWLHGIGPPRDVTRHYTTACTAPLTLCICFLADEFPKDVDFDNAVLHVCEARGEQRLLGRIRLMFTAALSVADRKLVLFRIRGSTNYCLPRIRLWIHYLLHALSHFGRNDPADIRMTLLEERAACVTFIRPHFLYLISIGETTSGNIFPMNLMGDLGEGFIGFALRNNRVVADLVQRDGRIAVSGIPLQRCSVPFQLAANYKKRSVDWNQLPFATRSSVTFGIPVPNFATRVRELQVELVHDLGSHRLFVARVISDETYTPDQQACVVHGFYQHWRLRGQPDKLAASVANDLMNKRGS